MSASEFKLDFAYAAQARLLQTLMNSESEEVSQAAGSARRDTVPGSAPSCEQNSPLGKMRPCSDTV